MIWRLPSALRISTHALHEEGDDFDACVNMMDDISTHALHEEGDHLERGIFSVTIYFYPRPPRGGRR